MSLADLTTKITADAEQQATSIIEVANKTVATLEEKSKKEREIFADAFSTETEHILKDNESRLRSLAEQEVKLLSEKSKREALDAIFSETLTNVTSFEDIKYAELLSKIVRKNLPRNIEGKAICPPNRLSITKKILADAGFTGEVTEQAEVKSGFIIINDTFEYDFTFAKTIEDNRQQLEIDIANTLFIS